MGEDQSNTVYDDNYGSCNSGPSVSVHTPLQCWNSEGWSDESWNEFCFDNNYEPLTELLPEEQHNNENSVDVSGYTSSESNDSEIEALASDKLSDVEDEPTSLPVDSTPTRELSCCNLLLKQFAIRHHITQDALSDLLELFSLYAPSYHWPSSVFLFNKQFLSIQNTPIFHHFCSDCFQLLTSGHEKKCSNAYCGKQFENKGDISSFIELPLEPQLTRLLHRTYT